MEDVTRVRQQHVELELLVAEDVSRAINLEEECLSCGVPLSRFNRQCSHVRVCKGCWEILG